MPRKKQNPTGEATESAAAPVKTESPKTPSNAPAKAPIAASGKAPGNAPAKSPAGASAKAPANAPAKAPITASAKAPINAPAKDPAVPVVEGMSKNARRKKAKKAKLAASKEEAAAEQSGKADQPENLKEDKPKSKNVRKVPEASESKISKDEPKDKKNAKSNFQRPSAFVVFVSNLAFRTTWQILKDTMREAGEVLKVELVLDRDDTPKGSALVTFMDAKSSKYAVENFDKMILDGRNISVRVFTMGVRPPTAKGNYSREQLDRVGAGHLVDGMESDSRGHGRGGYSADRGNGGSQYNRFNEPSRRDRDDLERGGYNGRRGGRGGRGRGDDRFGGGHVREYDGGDFNRRNNETFGDDFTRDEAPRGTHGGFNRDRNRDCDFESHRGPALTDYFVSVGNLPYSCDCKLLKNTFGQVASVVHAEVVQDYRGKSKGYGFVEFSSKRDADTAIIEFDTVEMEGRAMRVQHSTVTAAREAGRR